MARLLAAICVLAVCTCIVLQCGRAFVPAPQSPSLRGNSAAVAAAGAAAVSSLPGAAEAFVYNGQERFDVTFGISPLAWAFAGFSIIFYGAALKYNKPYGTSTLKDPKPLKVGGFVGMEVENNT